MFSFKVCWLTEQKLLVNQRHHVQTSRIHFHHFWVYIIGYCAIHSSTPIKHSRPSKQPPTTNMQHVTVCYCLTLRTNKLHTNDMDPVTHAECSSCVIALWGESWVGLLVNGPICWAFIKVSILCFVMGVWYNKQYEALRMCFYFTLHLRELFVQCLQSRGIPRVLRFTPPLVYMW